MTSLGMRRCRPLISPLVAGTKPVHPLDAGPGVHDEDMASRARAPRGWPPGAGRIGARPRNCGSWWAATRLQRPATRLDVSCRVAAPRRGHVVVWARRYQSELGVLARGGAFLVKCLDQGEVARVCPEVGKPMG